MSAVAALPVDMYAEHLAGGAVRGEGAAWHDVPMRDWFRDRVPGDDGLLDRCLGPTLDVGCGPGRLTAALLGRGVPCLGIDVSPVAVDIARGRGAAALHRDVHHGHGLHIPHDHLFDHHDPKVVEYSLQGLCPEVQLKHEREDPPSKYDPTAFS